MKRLRARGRPAAASLFAGLLGAVLLAGTVEIHGTAGEHSALDRPTVVFTDARHADQPAHLETSAVLEVPRCAWCVLHAQSLGDALRVPARLAGPALARTVAGTPSGQPSSSPRLRPLSRGPPLS
ncbi:MAG TPA: hypothetical protein VGC93_15670 [Thermoanaerobaculia bacterium]